MVNFFYKVSLQLLKVVSRLLDDKNYQNLTEQHQELKHELEKINEELGNKFGSKNNISQKIDELNQETESLIDEIEKWQT